MYDERFACVLVFSFFSIKADAFNRPANLYARFQRRCPASYFLRHGLTFQHSFFPEDTGDIIRLTDLVKIYTRMPPPYPAPWLQICLCWYAVSHIRVTANPTIDIFGKILSNTDRRDDGSVAVRIIRVGRSIIYTVDHLCQLSQVIWHRTYSLRNDCNHFRSAYTSSVSL